MKIYSYVKPNNLEIKRLEEDVIYVNRNFLTLKQNEKIKIFNQTWSLFY